MPSFEKVILTNNPSANSNGQYNYGQVTGRNLTILGKPIDEFSIEENELFTTVEDKQISPSSNLWNYNGSKLSIENCHIQGTSQETDRHGGHFKWHTTQVAIYIFDQDQSGDVFSMNGNDIRDLIGDGDAFTNSQHTMGYHHYGDVKVGTAGAHGENQDALGDVVGDSGLTSAGMTISDFPIDPSIPADQNPSFGTDTETELPILNNDTEKWTSDSLGNSFSHYYIVVRTSGDEHVATWFLGWSHSIDNRNRGYTVFKLKKRDLYDVFAPHKNVAEKTLGYGYNNGTDLNGAFDVVLERAEVMDNYGEGGGWFNYSNVQWKCDGIKIKIIAPEWSPDIAETNNSRWTPESLFTLLKPSFDIDNSRFPDDWYPDPDPGKIDNTYVDLYKLMLDFRPINSVSTMVETVDEDTDVQNYYAEGTLWNVNSSAPNSVKLTFKLAENTNKFYIDYLADLNNYEDDVKYGFTVANWNWKEGDPETLEEITEKQFPHTEDGLFTEQLQNNTFKFKKIGTVEEDPDDGYFDFTVYKDEAANTYSDSGMKIIKAIVFSYMETDHIVDGIIYIQALRWKLATIKIYLSSDRAFINDFTDVGGSDFVFLPYPDIFKYKLPDTVEFECSDGSSTTIDDCLCGGGGDTWNGSECVYGTPPTGETWNQLWCDDPYMPMGAVYNDHITCTAINTEHVIISGLTEESIYVQSLNAIIKQEFGKAEKDEKELAHKAYENTPGQTVDEYGNFLGTSNVAQVRFFTGQYDMREFLDIDIIHGPDPEDFHPHTDSDPETGYWTGNADAYPSENQMPMESPGGDIFISEYPSLADKCLVEINCGDPDGFTLRDTSGNGNKGILIGDFSIKKRKINIPTVRDSYIDFPKIGVKDGAF